MILKFPNLDTLRLALTTGAVPATVSTTAAIAGFDDQDQVWIETSASLPRSAQNELKKLGVQSVRTSGARLSAAVSCWPELLPLVAEDTPLERLEQTPVLFDLTSGEDLARLATEMLRLGNDRQGYRWLEAPSRNGKADNRALLRVVGPPYYSLLRALAPAPGQRQKRTAPVAFLERAPGVWVEMGHVHPLVERIKPPKGKLLLLRPPRHWDVIDDAPFHDVYEAIDFQLPDSRTRWHEGDLAHRIGVTLSLRTGGAPEGAELWVLRADAVNVLDRFVQNADDQLLHRLSFAVGTKDGQTTIVLRVRQTRLPPPVLVFPEGDALGYRPYLKLPNLFLPVGSRLHPPLRRDVVRKLLADDPDQVTWLLPRTDSGVGAFTPESLPEDAFRPLTDWIDYILDREKENLDAWVQAAHFDFEPFICSEDPPPKPRKPPGQEKSRSGNKGARSVAGEKATSTSGEERFEVAATEEEVPALEEFEIPAKVEPSEIQKQLQATEERFLALEGGLDAPERQRMWPELAGLNAALGRGEEAGLCWANALWFEETPVGQAGAAAWFRAEVQGTPPPTWLTRLKTAEGRWREVSGSDLDALLKKPEPSVLDLRVLAAYVIWSARRTPPPAALLERLSAVQRFLETHERLLPVRATWLAWTHLVQLSRGDVLALARARDRLLERLYQNGLRPEYDLPGFLRFAGQPSSQRFRTVREWFARLGDAAVAWVKESQGPGPGEMFRSSPMMEGYVNLIFAFGLARLGERDAANARLDRARAILGKQDEAHRLMMQAFQHRITQALNSQAHSGPLPDALLAAVEKVDRMPRYVIDQMRRHSRILEPDQHIDPYRHWSARSNELEQELAALTDETDRDEIRSRVLRLYKATTKSKSGLEERARILRAGLEAAPRVGEEFGRYLLDQTLPTFDALPEPVDPNMLEERSRFLERALFVAAHFDQLDSVQHLVARFEKMLQAQSGPQVLQAINLLAGQCFRGLRKLGMRDEIDRLLALMAELILEGKDVASADLRKLPQGTSALLALLHVAAGWYYFNRDRQAEPILHAVRGILLEGKLPPREQKALAAEYARTAGQAPVELAQKRLEEMFGPLRGVYDSFTTSTHYSVHQIDVVEAVVLAVVSDDFTLGSQARRWLDDDEFLVRRRIHRDVRQQLSHG